jgi:hypothetical protein
MDMQPIKVNLPADFATFSGMEAYTQSNYMASMTSAEWSNAVNAVAPFLNAQGLKQALAILDCAIGNIQRSKVISEACGYGDENFCGDGAGYAFHRAAISAQLQAHMDEQQHMLMQELHQLPLRYGLMSMKIPPMMPAAHLGFNPDVNFNAHPMAMEMPWISADIPAPMMPARPDVCSFATPAMAGPCRQVSEESMADSVGKSSTRRRAPQTLSSSLRLLENEDPDCLLIVRRIGKLGFKAARSLKKHYSAYGHVTKVLLAHSTARQYCDNQFTVKRRPSNLGFIQMATAEGAKKAIAEGEIQEIEGVSVSVQKFERHDADVCDEDGEGVETAEVEAMSDSMSRQTSTNTQSSKSGRKHGMSDVSTVASPPLSFSNGTESGSDS